MHSPLFRKVDCVRLGVPDLEAALAFYRDQLGLGLVWRTETEAGLSLSDTDTEIVLQTEHPGLEVDLLVGSADEAAQIVERAGGHVRVPAFDIRIGRCVVVSDPWDNELVLLDLSKGRLRTDAAGNIVGQHPPE
ncbi:MAG TPA: VOC family protein [Anaerolineales bacterium]|nr:VOC family protein [Anaerolineales bacterium]